MSSPGHVSVISRCGRGVGGASAGIPGAMSAADRGALRSWTRAEPPQEPRRDLRSDR